MPSCYGRVRLALIAMGLWASISQNAAGGLLVPVSRIDIGGASAAEILAYDAQSQQLFITNIEGQRLDVYSLADVTAPSFLNAIDLSAFGGQANSVAVAGGIVAAAIQAEIAQNPGLVAFFDLEGTSLGQVGVGALPDMLVFTPNGRFLLVANEGEPDDEYLRDPEGSVSIIDLSRGVVKAIITTVDFRDFNQGGPRAVELPPQVRIFGPGASVAQDLEPEYIAVDPDGEKAYVSLQENNAIAIINIADAHVDAIHTLGFKDHNLTGNGFDASDSDSGVNISNWPVLGMYQPDSIAAFRIDGVTYIATANEGDGRSYKGYSEEIRIADLALDPVEYPDADLLQKDVSLGRLSATNATGDTDSDGDIDQIYIFGGRSFSLWNAATGAQVFDSGSQFEHLTSGSRWFNAENGNLQRFDGRSDDRGPEPEAIVVGAIGERQYVFVGLEGSGGIMVYDTTIPTRASFRAYAPPEDLDADGIAEDISPEGLVFIPASDSPSGEPLLAAANELSGTVRIYRVIPPSQTPLLGAMGTIGLVLLVIVGFVVYRTKARSGQTVFLVPRG